MLVRAADEQMSGPARSAHLDLTLAYTEWPLSAKRGPLSGENTGACVATIDATAACILHIRCSLFTATRVWLYPYFICVRRVHSS